MASFTFADHRPVRLHLGAAGPHRFGGPPTQKGVTPRDTDTPLHLILQLDLTDPKCPFKSDDGLRYLPLYYPLKYGYGGGAVQYAVRSDQEIEILHISEDAPDAEDDQYVRVRELPECSAELLDLRYEEARILAFAGGAFQPNAEDWTILNGLERDHPVILVGGHTRLPVNAGDVICRNHSCKFFSKRVWSNVITAVPPVPVNGTDDFWHEFQGGHLKFYFSLCEYCQTVIAFNVAT